MVQSRGSNFVSFGCVHTKDDLYRIYNSLKTEGRVIMEICELPWSPLAATVMDRFGVRWYITLPQHRPD